MTEESKKKSDPLLLALLTHHDNELQARRGTEITYVSASVAGLGAIAWGVAVLITVTDKTGNWPILFSTMLTLLGVVAIVHNVLIKIFSDHRAFMDVRNAEGAVLRRLMTKEEINKFLPKRFLDQTAGEGYKNSIYIVVAAALPAAGFCVAVLLNNWPR